MNVVVTDDTLNTLSVDLSDGRIISVPTLFGIHVFRILIQIDKKKLEVNRQRERNSRGRYR